VTGIGTDELCHTASAEVAVDARTAFEYLSDGLKQGEWTLGSWHRERVDADLYRGRSLFDGRELYIRIRPDEKSLVVDYEVGRKPESLLRVNSARTVPGPTIGRPEGTCVVTLMKWRTPDEDDAAWRRACVTFSTEIHMIKGRLELEF
jgi:hypothetical protein